MVYLDTHKFDEAIGDFTRSHELDPKDPWALANRGLAHAWKRDTARAEQDFAAARAVDPSNIVLLHGEGLMAMDRGDLETAIARFTAALSHDPSDPWALQMRADAYQQLSDFPRAQADREKLRQLAQRAGSQDAAN